MKISKLSFDLDFNFDLLGLVSSIKEYKLAWCINQSLHVKLVKEKDIKIEFITDKNIIISNFIFQTEYSTLRLIKNRAEDTSQHHLAFLLPELKQFDYFLMLTDEGDTYLFSDLVEKLRAIHHIQFIAKIDTSNLKSKENLIF